MLKLKKTIFIWSLVVFSLFVLISSSFAASETKLVVKNSTAKYSEKCDIIVILTDKNGTSLEDKYVELKVDGWNLDKWETDSDGEIQFSFDTGMDGYWYNKGKYTVSAKFYGTNDYSSSSSKGYLTIKSMPTSLTMDYKADKNGKKAVIFSLVDEHGSLVGSSRVNLYVDGKLFSYGITNEKGTTLIDISNLSPGKHSLVGINSNIGNNYVSDKKTMEIFVKSKNTISYEKTGKSENSNLSSASASMKSAGVPVVALMLLLMTMVGAMFSKK